VTSGEAPAIECQRSNAMAIAMYGRSLSAISPRHQFTTTHDRVTGHA